MSDIIEAISILFIAAGLALFLYSDGYKRGQVDALSGARIKYELVTKPNGEQRWERIAPRKTE